MLASIFSNQAICELTENFRQLLKCLFQSVKLFFYACKTLKPGLFWYAVEREPVIFFFGGGLRPPPECIPGLGIFFRIGGL